MVILDSNEQQTKFPSVEVEVRSDNESLKGAWYTATIINCPSNSKASPSNSRKKTLIQYKTLISEDGVSPLTECVFPSQIRPLPPQNDDVSLRIFEENDVVDAWYRNGWWPGTVFKVLRESKYSILFENLHCIIDFHGADLRTHFDWVFDKWVRPDRWDAQFSPAEVVGSPVVTPAPIIGRELGEEPLMKPLRVLLPRTNGGKRHKSESYVVGDETSAEKEKLSTRKATDAQFSPTEVVGSPVATPVPIIGRELGEEPSMKPLRILLPRTNGGKRHKPESCVVGESESCVVGDQTSAEKEKFSTRKATDTREENIVEAVPLSVDAGIRKERPTRSPLKRPLISESVNESNTIDDPAKHITEAGSEAKEARYQIVLGLQAKGKRWQLSDSSSQLVMNSSDLTGGENMEVTHQTRRGRKRSQRTGARSPKTIETVGTAEVSESNSMPQSESDMSLALVLVSIPEDDPSFSTWFEGLLPGKPADGANELNGQVVEISSSAVAERTEDVPGVNALPFTKSSPLWKTIESRKVFQILPQKPHFSPLADCMEEYREVAAIGIMVSFASLYEKISSLQFDDSRSTFENTLDNLHDIERYGLDVSTLRARVNELLQAKDGQVEFTNEFQDSEKQIHEISEEKRKIDRDIRDIKKKMSQLLEDLTTRESDMEFVDQNLARLQAKVESARIEIARKHFEKVATSPLKLPVPVVPDV